MEVAEARPQDVRLSLTWHGDANGALVGELLVRNVSDRRVRLSGKPGLQPLGVGGAPLGAETIVSTEWLSPGYVDIDPGEAAVAAVTWPGWNGPTANGEVTVYLRGGARRINASGPRQPESLGPPTNLTSSWFKRHQDGR